MKKLRAAEKGVDTTAITNLVNKYEMLQPVVANAATFVDTFERLLHQDDDKLKIVGVALADLTATQAGSVGSHNNIGMK
eukprot:2593044-Prorocentrum_lima.AAC.1